MEQTHLEITKFRLISVLISTYRALPNGIDDPFLFRFLDNFLIESRVPVGSRDIGKLQGWNCDDFGSFWQGRAIDQLFLYPG